MKSTYLALIVLVLSALVASGCAGLRTTGVDQLDSRAAPGEINNGVSNQYYDAVLAVQWNESRPCCTEFHLRVTNNTGKEIKILWAKTSYIHDGAVLGGFTFPGSACDEKENPATESAIAPGKSFTITIWPARLSHVSGADKTCLHSPMEPGINGILLTVESSEAEVTEKILLDTTSAGYPYPQ